MRTQALIPQPNCCFADDYDVYVDYGKGQPIKMKNNEATFLDVERFLSGRNDKSKAAVQNKSVASSSERS